MSVINSASEVTTLWRYTNLFIIIIIIIIIIIMVWPTLGSSTAKEQNRMVKSITHTCHSVSHGYDGTSCSILCRIPTSSSAGCNRHSAKIGKLVSRPFYTIHCLRQHFARHGLPLAVISDNSPFASAEFKRFADRFDFKQITSSPRYPQSNGRVENAIKTVNSIMTKARKAKTDPFLALLFYCLLSETFQVRN